MFVLFFYVIDQPGCPQFRRKAQRDDGTLSEAEFADLMLCYAGFPAKKKRAMIKRVRKA